MQPTHIAALLFAAAIVFALWLAVRRIERNDVPDAPGYCCGTKLEPGETDCFDCRYRRPEERQRVLSAKWARKWGRGE